MHPSAFLNDLFVNDAETPGRGNAVSAVVVCTCQSQLLAGFLN